MSATVIELATTKAWKKRDYRERRVRLSAASASVVGILCREWDEEEQVAKAMAIAACTAQVACLAELSADYGDLGLHEAYAMMEMWSTVEVEIGLAREDAMFAACNGAERAILEQAYGAALRDVQRVGTAMVEAAEALRCPDSTVRLYGTSGYEAGFPMPGGWREREPEAC